MSDVSKRRFVYDRQNSECARIILANRAREAVERDCEK
jgi:hypothetical protein